MFLRRISIALLVAFFFGCQVDTEMVKSRSWKYTAGYWLTDIIYFDLVFKIKHDTIFKQDTPVAVFKTVKGILGKDELIIKSVNSGEEGYYHEFGNKMQDKIIIEQQPLEIEQPPEEITPERPNR